MDFEDLFRSIDAQNTTLKFDLESRISSPPIDGDSSININLRMVVPQQQKIRVNLPFLESFKLAYM